MPRVKKDAEVVRLSLEVSPAVRERMDSLLKRTEADSLTAVIRRSLVVYDLLMTHFEQGGRIILTGAGEPDQRLVLP